MEAAREGGLHCIYLRRKGAEKASLVICLIFFAHFVSLRVCNPLKLSRVRGHDTQLQRMRYPP